MNSHQIWYALSDFLLSNNMYFEFPNVKIREALVPTRRVQLKVPGSRSTGVRVYWVQAKEVSVQVEVFWDKRVQVKA